MIRPHQLQRIWSKSTIDTFPALQTARKHSIKIDKSFFSFWLFAKLCLKAWRSTFGLSLFLPQNSLKQSPLKIIPYNLLCPDCFLFGNLYEILWVMLFNMGGSYIKCYWWVMSVSALVGSVFAARDGLEVGKLLWRAWIKWKFYSNQPLWDAILFRLFRLQQWLWSL